MIKMFFLFILAMSFAAGFVYYLMSTCDSSWCTWFDWQKARQMERRFNP